MSIDKIGDLGKYYVDPFTYYYESEHVKELVDNLQSKMPIWYKLEEALPQYNKNIIVILKETLQFIEVKCFLFWGKEYFVDKDDNFYSKEEIQFWTYKTTLIKSI